MACVRIRCGLEHQSFLVSLAAPVAGTDVSAALRADPYEVLGVPHDAAAGAVKKRYWRLSLMIHPDKCRHQRAAEAFQASAAAAKMLQVRFSIRRPWAPPDLARLAPR